MLTVKNTSDHSAFFQFKLEDESTIYTIPQTVNDGSDTISFSSSWTKESLPGSTEPMVAFNYVDAPTIPINLKLHQDMWRAANLDENDYIKVVNKFVSMIYPGENGDIIKPPYCMIYVNNCIYRGYFSSIRVNQSGIMRNGVKVVCEINSSFTILKKTSPKQIGVGSDITGYRVYFSE